MSEINSEELLCILKEIAEVEFPEPEPKPVVEIKKKKKERDETKWIDKEDTPDWDKVNARQILDECNDDDDDTEIYEVTDMETPIEGNCGLEVYLFTKEQLEGMLNGKIYWADCNAGEYAHLFTMKKEGERDE